MRSIISASLIVVAGLVTLGCGERGEPLAPQLVIIPANPHPVFLIWRPDLQPQTFHASVTAVRGKKSRLQIRFQRGGDRFLRLEIGSETLRWRPDGTPMAKGESITIDAYVDPIRMIVTFHPAGLVFNPLKPAELELRYGSAAAALPPEAQIHLWRQEAPNQPWLPVQAVAIGALDKLRTEADLGGFTRYALAIGR